MAYVLIDLFASSILNIHFNTFFYYLNYIKIKEFLTCLFLLILLNENILLIIIIAIMYALNILLYKYINRSFVFELAIYTFFYIVLFRIDAYYVLNVFLIIVLRFTKYNRIR